MTTLKEKIKQFKKDLLFWSQVSVLGEDDCWEWQTSLSIYGYGQFNFKKKMVRAHRYAFENLVEKIKPGMYIDHICRNRKCVNPMHLRQVTPRQNLLENSMNPFAIMHNNNVCKNGHPLDENNTIKYKNKNRIQRRCRICTRKAWREWYCKRNPNPSKGPRAA